MTVRVTPWADGERGQRRWMVDVRARRADGSKVRDRKIIEGPRTTAAAWGERRQAVLLGEIRAGADVPRQALTVAQWAPTFVKRHYQGKKQSAIDAATSIVDTHVVPFVGDVPLDRITQTVADELVSRWREGGYRETKRDRVVKPCRSEKTINNRKVVVLSMLKYAIECSGETGLTAMPCKIRLARVDAQRAPEFYELDAYATIVDAASKVADPRALAVVLLGGDAGLREGEIVALTWADVDYRAGKVTPRTSVYQRRAGERFTAETKGKEAKPVRMTDRLVAALKRLPRKGDHVIHVDGQPMTSKALRYLVKRVERAAGLTAAGAVHKLRHTYASHLAIAGVPARQIMAMCRHKNLSTTLRYMHLARDGQDHAVTALERLRAAG